MATEYNGWTANVRSARSKRFYYAMRRWGTIPRASECMCCHLAFGDGLVPYHSEDYGPSVENFAASCTPLCNRCHAMLHERFTMPNRWKSFLSDAAAGRLNITTYPTTGSVATLRSRFRALGDVPEGELSGDVPAYLRALPLERYAGPSKGSILEIARGTGEEPLKVPDFLCYGEKLDRATDGEVASIRAQGVDVDAFLRGELELPRKRDGRLAYLPAFKVGKRPYYYADLGAKARLG